ncbi:MAG: ferritin family protein [Armatimonadota bacterium]
MATSRQDVVQAALQLERDGRKFYLDAASKAANDVARSWFESFADDELRHIEWIQQLSAGEGTVNRAKKEMYSRLSGIFRDAPETARRAALESENDMEAIRLATAMEEKSVAAYVKWAEESEDQDLRDLCNVLADYERLHVDLLQNAAQYLSDPAEWFRQEERWIVEG